MIFPLTAGFGANFGRCFSKRSPPQAVKEAGIFNPDSIQTLINGHMDRTLNVGYHLWGLMTLHLWLKKWNVDTCLPVEQEACPAAHAYAS